jgi:flagellar motor switch protein FliM
MNLEVGQTLLLNAGPNSPVEMRCGGIALLNGKMGRVGHQVAVRVESSIQQKALLQIEGQK